MPLIQLRMQSVRFINTHIVITRITRIHNNNDTARYVTDTTSFYIKTDSLAYTQKRMQMKTCKLIDHSTSGVCAGLTLTQQRTDNKHRFSRANYNRRNNQYSHEYSTPIIMRYEGYNCTSNWYRFKLTTLW